MGWRQELGVVYAWAVVEVVGMDGERVGLGDPTKDTRGNSSGERKRRLALRDMRT